MSIRRKEDVTVDGGAVKDPVDQGLVRRTTIVGGFVHHIAVPGEQFNAAQLDAGTGVIRFIGSIRHHHGLHAVEIAQLCLFILQLQLQFFYLQTLALQLQVGQGGVKGHQDITFLHLVTLLHQNIRHSLGIGQKDRLNFVGGNGTVALLRVAPVFRHAHILKGHGVNWIGIGMARPVPEHAAHRCRGNTGANADDPLFSGFPKVLHIKLHGQPPLCQTRGCAVRRPECGRSFPHRRQWPVHG